VLLIFVSVLIWSTNITGLQFFGYSIALIGLLIYSEVLKWEQLANLTTWVKVVWESPALDENRLSPTVKKVLLFGLGAGIIIMLYVGLGWQDAASPSPTPVGAPVGA
jgi:hypothetical protein